VRLFPGCVTVLVSVAVFVSAVAVAVWLELAESVELAVALASLAWAFVATVDACWASVPDLPDAQATTNDVASVAIPTRIRTATDAFGEDHLQFGRRPTGTQSSRAPCAISPYTARMFTANSVSPHSG
jgi:hypothetical protein